MKKSFVIYTNPHDRNDATSKYLDIIDGAFRAAGYTGGAITNSLDDIDPVAVIVTINCQFAIRACWQRRSNRLVHWFQGIEAEERRFLHRGIKGWLQEWLWSRFENTILRKANLSIFVSDEMVKHYQRKHQVPVRGMVMPCYNAALMDQSFDRVGKYAAMNLVYAGSLHPWQCVGQVLSIYRELRKLAPETRLTILTRELEAAKQLCAEQSMPEVAVRSVPVEKIAEELSQFSCGFILRNEMPINEVSTPTKLSSYMAAGVMPVLTTATPALNRIVADTEFKCVLQPGADPADAAARILEVHRRVNDAGTVKASYRNTFDRHFNDADYIRRLSAEIEAI